MKTFFHLAFLLLISGKLMAQSSEANPYVSIYDDVIQANANASVQSCEALQHELANSSAEQRHAAFVRLAEGWGSVQASYVLGGYDMDAMDYPLMIDYFHMGKEDIHETLARLLVADTPVKKALYKNSYKTLEALDDVMFSGPWSARRQAMAEVISARICSRLTRIRDGYREYRNEFLGDEDKALSLLVNAQIENIYKTRDWRIAQISGLTKDTLGQPAPHKQQYPYSQASWAAIGAMLATHNRLLADDQQPNVATIAYQKSADDEGMVAVQAELEATLQAFHGAPENHNYDTAAMIPFFQGLLDLQNAFYRQLVGSIGVTANLIDADGD